MVVFNMQLIHRSYPPLDRRTSLNYPTESLLKALKL